MEPPIDSQTAIHVKNCPMEQATGDRPRDS